MGQDVVIYLSEKVLTELYEELYNAVGDGKSDIILQSVPWLIFRLKGTIE